MSAIATVDAGESRMVEHGDAMVSMIERAAINPSVDIDKLERLLEMQERIVARNAKAAYAAAFSEMQTELPEIPKRGKGHGNITYALWEDVNELIKPVMGRYGFGMSFKVGRQGDKLTITGILLHREGHSEETTIELPADTSGSKNAVQAIGSSTSYGKRYTAQALLNLTSRGEDDDGHSSGRKKVDLVSEDQVIELREMIEATDSDMKKFLALGGYERLDDMLASDFDAAMRTLKQRQRR